MFIPQLVLLKWEMFQTDVVEKVKTHILCSVPFFENRTVNETMWKNGVEPDRSQTPIGHMRITGWIPKLHTHTHTHTLEICHT